MNVLLLDDEPLEVDQLEYLIHSHYPMWQVIKATNASEAMEKSKWMVKQGNSLHLGLIDIKLPGKTGLEVAAELKSLFHEMDIIIISAFQDFHYARSSIQLGVLDYLVKPVLEEELLKILKRYVNQHPEFEAKSHMIQKVLQIVHDHYKEKLNLSEIASELHINTSYLSRRFREDIGLSFSDYLLKYRIEVAKTLLHKNRDWSMQRIAEEAGFNSQNYFSSAFKKLTGLSPKEYQNQL
ncbi:Response regulator containing CheY-like receiver domain and AraC-type DNA-binding domain [[Clostridium] ultunense Esp]|nr:Response regulator containing CheY-like receiver domain and AraC-type DNA-binding domain [[Clostridium] ultunense Esp]